MEETSRTLKEQLITIDVLRSEKRHLEHHIKVVQQQMEDQKTQFAKLIAVIGIVALGLMTAAGYYL